jgi:hypothetical protein
VNVGRPRSLKPADDCARGIHVPRGRPVAARNVERREITVIDHITSPYFRIHIRHEAGQRATIGRTTVIHRRRHVNHGETVLTVRHAVHSQHLISVVNTADNGAVSKNSLPHRTGVVRISNPLDVLTFGGEDE